MNKLTGSPAHSGRLNGAIQDPSQTFVDLFGVSKIHCKSGFAVADEVMCCPSMNRSEAGQTSGHGFVEHQTPNIAVSLIEKSIAARKKGRQFFALTVAVESNQF